MQGRKWVGSAVERKAQEEAAGYVLGDHDEGGSVLLASGLGSVKVRKSLRMVRIRGVGEGASSGVVLRLPVTFEACGEHEGDGVDAE